MSAIRSGKRNVVVILNGLSRYKKIFYHKFYNPLSQVCNLQVWDTRSKNEAISLASRAAGDYAHVVLAAGGDGTLHQVVHGILDGREKDTKLPVIGVIPIGSGNDFARALGIKSDVTQLKNLLEKFEPKTVDVGMVNFTPLKTDHDPGKSYRYFINVADIGMGPTVVEKVVNSGRPFGPSVAYYTAIISTFFYYKPVEVTAVADGWSWQGKMRSLAVANGKFYGHGICVAPDAKPDDRMFDVFICGNVSVLDFIKHSGAMKKGKYVQLPDVSYRKTTSITLTSKEQCLLEADGEILGVLPAKIQLIDKRLDLLC